MKIKYLAFSYIECNIERLIPVIFEIWNDKKYSILTGQHFEKMYEIEQLPGGAHFEKIIIFQVNDSGCIMLTNYADGLSSTTYIITSQLDVEILNFRLSSNTCQYPVNSISCIKNGEGQRVIYALKENKWFFYSCGNPLWFEVVENYESKFIKNRINESIIINYCNKLGLDIMDPNFWRSDNAVLIERHMW